MKIDTTELKELMTLLDDDGVDGFMYAVFRGKDSASVREYGNIYPQNVQMSQPLSDELMNTNELVDRLRSKQFDGDHTDWVISDAIDLILQQDQELKRLKNMYEPSTKEYLGVDQDGNLMFKDSES